MSSQERENEEDRAVSPTDTALRVERSQAEYLLRAQPSEIDRLRRQSLAWEPAGRNLLREFEPPRAARAVDLGCGSLGWLRLLSEWVGPGGSVVGTDIDPLLLGHATDFCRQERLEGVTLVEDDLFASNLSPATFDLVHARFQVSPLGRAEDIVDTMLRLVRPGGLIVLEDPSAASWRFHPAAPATDQLVQHILTAFAASGGCFDAGEQNVQTLRRRGLDVEIRAAVLGLDFRDPYLRLPLQFAHSLRAALSEQMGAVQLDALIAASEKELSDSRTWGLSFTLIQVAARAAPEG